MSNLFKKTSYKWEKVTSCNCKQGNSPGSFWQIAFSELPGQKEYRYLVALVGTFSGWAEAFPCHTNKTREVVKIRLKLYQPGDFVCVKTWNLEPLKEKWKGAFQVLLVTNTALKVEGTAPCVQHTQVKPASTDETQQKWDWNCREVFSFSSCGVFALLCNALLVYLHFVWRHKSYLLF